MAHKKQSLLYVILGPSAQHEGVAAESPRILSGREEVGHESGDHPVLVRLDPVRTVRHDFVRDVGHARGKTAVELLAQELVVCPPQHEGRRAQAPERLPGGPGGPEAHHGAVVVHPRLHGALPRHVELVDFHLLV